MSFQRLPRKRGGKVNFFFENLSLLPETRAPKNQSLQEKNPTFQNLGLIFRPKNQNFPFPTCPRHTTSPIFGPPCPNFLDPLPHSLKIAPAVLLASCAWDADGEIDEEDEEEHNNTKKRQRLLLAATLRRRAPPTSPSPHFLAPSLRASGGLGACLVHAA